MFLKHKTRMISGGSCDTEDWSNDGYKFSYANKGINFFKYVQTESSFKIVIHFSFKNSLKEL